jgi:hypothetical protein
LATGWKLEFILLYVSSLSLPPGKELVLSGAEGEKRDGSRVFVGKGIFTGGDAGGTGEGGTGGVAES